MVSLNNQRQPINQARSKPGVNFHPVGQNRARHNSGHPTNGNSSATFGQQQQQNTRSQYLGKKISIISKAAVRYTGILSEIDQEKFTLTLSNVKSYGTEERDHVEYIPPVSTTFPTIQFNAAELLDLQDCTEDDNDIISTDPAILSVSDPSTKYYPPSNKHYQNNSQKQHFASNPVKNTAQIFASNYNNEPQHHTQNYNKKFSQTNRIRNHTNNQQNSGNLNWNQPARRNYENKNFKSALSRNVNDRSKSSGRLFKNQTASDIDFAKELNWDNDTEEKNDKKSTEANLFTGENCFFDSISGNVPEIDLSKKDFKKENVETFGKDYFNLTRSAHQSKFRPSNRKNAHKKTSPPKSPPSNLSRKNEKSPQSAQSDLINEKEEDKLITELENAKVSGNGSDQPAEVKDDKPFESFEMPN